MNDVTLGNISRYAFIILAVLLPIWVLPYTIFPLEMNKAFLFYAITIIAALFSFIAVLQKASFKIPKSAALLAFAGVAAVWLASSLFSSNTMLSLVGFGHEVGTLFSFVLMGVAMLLVSILFQPEIKVLFFYFALFASSILVFIFQLFRAVFNVTLLPWDIFTSKIANTIGSWNEVGIFFGFIALISLVFLELFHFGKWLKFFLALTLVASLAAVALVNFTSAWIVLGIFLMVFLVYLYSAFLASSRSEGEPRRKFIRFAIVVLLISLFFIMARNLVGDVVLSSGISSVEVRPAWSATWQVIKSAFAENFLVGTGPNTFLYDWLKFKPSEINLTLFWAFPFQAGIGLLPSFLATSGILGGLFWALFFVILLYYGLKIITYSENELTRGLLIASFLGALYLWTFAVIYPSGFTLISLAFLTTGVFIALLCSSGRIKMIEASFLHRPKIGFISSLVVIILMIASVASFYLLFQKYWAAYSFGQGILVFNSESNIDKAENLIGRAARFDQQDRYYRALSEIGLIRIQQLVNSTNLPQDEAILQFQNLLGSAINNAETATRLNSLDFLNWMSLGQVYESIIPFNISGSKEAAVNAYAKAAQQAPFDPRPLFNSGRAEAQAGDMKSAKTFLSAAVNIKGDFAPAVFLLAQIEAQQGNIKEAINRTFQAAQLAPNDVGVLFQLGLLYYQDKNFENSRLAFERAVSLNQNYSNARYFLGLIYDNADRKNDAIEQFKKIQELNPDNQEVERILANLTSGKPILEGISPPQPAPEKRPEVPVNEGKIEKELEKNP